MQIGKLFFASFAFFFSGAQAALGSSLFYQRGRAAEHDIDREEFKGRAGE